MRTIILSILSILLVNVNLISQTIVTADGAVLEENSNDPDYPPEDKYKGFYRLTAKGTFDRGAIWNSETVNLEEPFVIEFVANYGDNDPDGADGVAFVFHKDPDAVTDLTTVIGDKGGAIGYGEANFTGAERDPIKNSIAFEFDTYDNTNQNFDENSQGDDHFDIRRNGDMETGNNFPTVKLYDGDIETGDDISTQIIWIPGTPDKSIGTLKVYFDCEVIYENNSFDIDQSLNWNGLDNVYFGMTAATGSKVNFHRVKLIPPELELTVEPNYCGNAQLNADFPILCGEVLYKWTNQNGTTDGLINPNTQNPIAYKNGIYECTVIHKDLQNTEFDDFFQFGTVTTKSINVQEVNLPRYSFKKRFANFLNFPSGETSYSVAGLCGNTLDASDCGGTLMSSWSRFKIRPDIKSNGKNTLIVNTDYFGDIQWSTFLVRVDNTPDIYTQLSQTEQENYTFYSHILNSGNNFSLNGNSLERKGYILTGETEDPLCYDSDNDQYCNGTTPSSKDGLIMKVDNNGNLSDHLIFDYSGTDQIGIKLFQLENEKYIQTTFSNDPKQILLFGLENNSNDEFSMSKKYLIDPNNINLESSNASKMSVDNISIPIDDNSIDLKDKKYKNVIAFYYNDSQGQNRIGILLLGDLFNSTINNILLDQVSIPDNLSNNWNIKLLYNESNNNIYIITATQVTEMSISNDQLTEINSYKYGLINYKDPNSRYSNQKLGSVDMDAYNNKINIMLELDVDGSSTIDIDGAVVEFNIGDPFYSTSAIRFPDDDKYYVYNNISSLDNGYNFAYSHIFGGGLYLTTKFDDPLNCTISEPIEVTTLDYSEVGDNLVNIIDPNINILSNTSFLEVDNFIKDYGYICNSTQLCDCNDFDEESFELTLLPKSKDENECCFDLFINNKTTCGLSDFKFIFTGTENLNNPPSDFTPSPGYVLTPNSGIKIGEFCKNNDGNPINLGVKLEYNGSICQNEDSEDMVWNIDLGCSDNCCDEIEINSFVAKPGDPCCYELTYDISSQLTCASQINLLIVDENYNLLHDQEGNLSFGQNTIEICFSSADVTGKLYNEFYLLFTDENGELICSKELNGLDLTACNCCEFDINYSFDEVQCELDVSLSNYPMYCEPVSVTASIHYLWINMHTWTSPPPDFPVENIENGPSLYDNNWIFESILCYPKIILIEIEFQDGTICKKHVFLEDCCSITKKSNSDVGINNSIGLKNIPNPAREFTIFEYNLPDENMVEFELYDVLGKSFGIIYKKINKKGKNQFKLQTSEYSTGVYIIKMEVAGNAIIRKFFIR